MVVTKILIVEDDGLTAIELENKLKTWGYGVADIVASGEDAIEKAFQIKPDLILMDIMLKGEINGIEAAKKINSLLDIPVIYITAYGDEKTLQSAKITEPYAYILKPFEGKEVKYAIEIALYKHRMKMRLKEDEEKFRLFYERAPLAYQSLDKYGRILEVNQAWIDTLGYSRDKVIGQAFSNFLTPKDKYDFKKDFEIFKDTGSYKTELEMIRKDGSYLTVEYECRIIRNENGDFKQVQCIFYNITEQRLAENRMKKSLIEKEMLLGEISHHLQNNYQTISSLIRRPSGKNKEHIEPPDLKKPAKISDQEAKKLRESDFAIVDFAQYVDSLINDLLHSYNIDSDFINVNSNIDNIMLDLDTALSCGLLINELVKNSLENALSTGRRGEIFINFHLDNEKFILAVSNEGINFSEDLKSKYSDMKLINTLVRQLGGIIWFDDTKSEFKVIFGELKCEST